MARSPKSSAGGDPISEDLLDRLYGAPPGDFVKIRDNAARELKAAGDDAAAAAVRALRRPSAPAAAINRAVRAERAQARALLDAADDLRRAHEAVMAGNADRDALKAATAAERQAVNALAATAGTETTGGGPASADVERRIRDTLGAVALDSGVREAFTQGRLEREARAAGLAMDSMPAGGKGRPAKQADDRRAKRDAEREQRRLEDAAGEVEETVARRRSDVEAAAAARERADAALREARRGLKEAETELRRARRAAERRPSR